MDTIYPMPLQSVAGKAYNAQVIVRAADLTETDADTDQTIEAIVAEASTKGYRLVHAKLVTPFKDSDDAANNSTVVSVGDGSDADRMLVAMEVNENGTEVPLKFGALTTPYIYAAADTIDILVESMTAKSLSDIDVGELHLFFEIAG